MMVLKRTVKDEPYVIIIITIVTIVLLANAQYSLHGLETAQV